MNRCLHLAPKPYILLYLTLNLLHENLIILQSLTLLLSSIEPSQNYSQTFLKEKKLIELLNYFNGAIILKGTITFYWSNGAFDNFQILQNFHKVNFLFTGRNGCRDESKLVNCFCFLWRNLRHFSPTLADAWSANTVIRKHKKKKLGFYFWKEKKGKYFTVFYEGNYLLFLGEFWLEKIFINRTGEGK